MLKQFIIIIITLISVQLQGQDPLFSIYKIDDTYLNPANTFNQFIDEDCILKLNLHFRDQWTSISEGDTYTTVKLQGDYNIYSSDLDGFNGGLMFVNDRSSNGGLVNTGLTLLGSYTRKLSQGRRSYGSHIITIGSSFTFAQSNMSLDKLWFGRQFDLNSNLRDLTLQSGEEFRLESFSYNDFNLGGRWMFVNDKNNYYMVGLSGSHLNNPTISSLNSEYTIPLRVIFQAEASFGLSENLNHIPSILYVKQDLFWQFRPSYHLSIDINNDDNSFALLAGVSTRITNTIDGIITDAIIFDIGLKSNSWNFNFSFDVNTSSLKTYTGRNGAIELSFGYILNSN